MSTFIASAHTDSASTASLVITKPAGTADNDILFALLKRSDLANPTGVPSGWALLGEAETAGFIDFWLYWKLAASEGADYTWSWADVARTGGTIVTYRGGFNTASPIDVTSNTTYQTSDTICRAASMTVAAANSSLFFFGAAHFTVDTLTFTKPSVPTTDWVEDVDTSDTGSRFGRETCNMTWTGSGATGTMDATMSQTRTDKHGFAVALNPAAAGAAVTSYDKSIGRGIGLGIGC